MTAQPSAPVGRGEHARRRIMTAALDQLADQGSAGFTMESIARRAGASKATLYRHWPSASALLVEAMTATFRPIPTRQTADVREDLVALLTQAAGLVTSERFPRLMAAIVDLAERDPALATLHEDLTQQQRRPVLDLVVRGQAEGRIPTATDPEVVVDLLVAPLFYRRLIAHRPVPDGMPRALVDQVLVANDEERPTRVEPA